MNPDPTVARQLVVSEERPEGILDELLALLSGTREADASVSIEQLEWKYLRNPDGAAVVWTLRTAGSGELVGFTACVPRRMRVNGQTLIVWNGADFSIDPHYRTLGPALTLRRQARLQIDAGRAGFLYAHPNDRMAIVHQRVGHVRLGRMVRMARLVNLKSKLQQQSRSRLASHFAGWLLDPALRVVSAMRWRGLEQVSVLDPLVFDERFDELFERHQGGRSIVGIRDSRYLNWRWGDFPKSSPTVIVDSQEGRLAGFLVLTEARGKLEIRDIFPGDDVRVVNRLLSAALKICVQKKASSVSITLLENNPLMETLHRRWFRIRKDSSDSYVYGTPAFRENCPLDAPDSWYMLSGDRDI